MNYQSRASWVAVASVFGMVLPALAQSPLGSEVTYQGRLTDSGVAVDGLAALRLSLFDAATGGNVVAGPIDFVNVPVVEGFFTVEVDFGAAPFGPDARWLEIEVKTIDPGFDCSDGTCFVLAPRQKVTAAPVALYALSGPPSGGGGDDGDWTFTDVNEDGIDDDLFATPAGNVGIGTDVPTAKLHVVTSVLGDGVLLPGLRTFITASFPNVIGGDVTNTIAPGLHTATIGGGANNTISGGGHQATIAGGAGHLATGQQATISGGASNAAGGFRAFIGGGHANSAQVQHATIGGGFDNDIQGVDGTIAGGNTNQIGFLATAGAITGGAGNRVWDQHGVVAGGQDNVAGSDDADATNQTHATVGGGNMNNATGPIATVSGGSNNTASGVQATIGGGTNNVVAGERATVAGGAFNQANQLGATVAGGQANIASAQNAAIGGGEDNQVLAKRGTIAGGGLVDSGTTGPGNRVFDNWGTVGGGGSNEAGSDDGSPLTAAYATVAGGARNKANAPFTAISGGSSNQADGAYAVVGGGFLNQALAAYATIAGGGSSDPFDEANTNNRVFDDYGTIGGGGANRAGSDDGDTSISTHATVAGGGGNNATGQGSTIGGGFNNDAIGFAATVGAGTDNIASGAYSTVAGGSGSIASGLRSTVAGGAGNSASGSQSTVVGGLGNIATASWAFVGGGGRNESNGDFATVAGGNYNYAFAAYATIAGGGPTIISDSSTSNRVFDDYGVVGGGGGNTAGTDDTDAQNAWYATVGGGVNNSATGSYSTVPGGVENEASGVASTVAGGFDNYATSFVTTVSGGLENTATDSHATVGGGRGNAAMGYSSTVGGGEGNNTTGAYSTVSGGAANAATGDYSTVGGGSFNAAAGDYSLAAGRRAKANSDGSFVWADATDADFASTGTNQFLIRASGGVGIGTTAPDADLHVLGRDNDGVTAALRISSQGGVQRLLIDGNEMDSNADLLLQFNSGNRVGIGTATPTDKLTVNGAVRATAFNTSSDARFKVNVAPVQEALELVKTLKAVRFDWRHDLQANREFPSGRELGFIAQDVVKSVPEIVSLDSEGFYSIDYSRVTPILVSAIQDQQQHIESQQIELEMLKSRLGSAIEFRNNATATTNTLGTLNFVNSGGQFPGQIRYENGASTDTLCFRVSSAERMRIEGTGNVVATGGMFVSNSDARLKRNVAPVADSLHIVEQLQAVNFHWRVDEFPERGLSSKRQLGFIAQDVLKILPEIVSEGSDGFYAVDYGRLTPLLVDAVRQLRAEKNDELAALWADNERLRQENTDLSARLDRIEAILRLDHDSRSRR